MLESNRLERVSAVDRHSDTIGRWRGRLIENADLAQIWATGRAGGDLDMSDAVWRYEVKSHKTLHHKRQRNVAGAVVPMAKVPRKVPRG